MTTQECIDLIPLLTQYDMGTYYGRTPSNANYVFLLNWAVRLIGKYIFIYKPDMAITLTTNSEHDLRSLTVVTRKVVEPFGLIVNGVKLQARKSGYGLWTMGELENDYPTWMTDDANTPARAAYTNFKLYVHPKPTAAVVAAGNSYLPAQVLPLDRTADSDPSTGLGTSPEIPLELHEAACFMASVKGALPNVSEQDTWKRLEAYSSEWAGIAREIRSDNRSSLIASSVEPFMGVFR